MTDIANEAQTIQRTRDAQKTLGTNYQPTMTAVPKVTNPAGAPSFWQRIQADGVEMAKKVASYAKSTAVSTTKAAVGAGEDVSNAIGNTEVRAGAKLGIRAKTGTQTPTQQFGKKFGSMAGTTVKEKIGNIAQTGLLGAGGGAEKVVAATGSDLLKTFGTQGVKDLAEKAGIDIGGKGSIEGAEQIAKTKVAQQAFQKTTTSIAGRAAKSSVKSAAGFGTFGAAQEASAGGSNKQILKAGAEGAAVGVGAGVAGSVIKTAVKAKLNKTPTIEKGTAPRDTTQSPVVKLGEKEIARQKNADERGLPSPQKTKLLPQGKIEPTKQGKDFTVSDSTSPEALAKSKQITALQSRITKFQQGKLKITPEQAKADSVQLRLLKKTATLDSVKAPKIEQAPKPKSRLALNESGAVAPGKAAEDIAKINPAITDYLDKNQKASEFKNNIHRDALIHEANNKQRLGSSAKLLKQIGRVPKEDLKAVYDYREAKSAGVEAPKLNENQQKLQDTISQIREATNKNKTQLVDLKAPGYSKDRMTYDATSGNHRIALGKGSSIERFGMGRSKSPLSARSLRTSTSSAKARVFYSATDEAGSRSQVAIQNVSVKQGLKTVSKGKFVNRINEDGSNTRLGKITPAELKSGKFTGSDGKTYKIGQSTANEITKATGQKYLKNPLVSEIMDYHETANALDSARMLESWKSDPNFSDIAVKHGDGVPPKGWKTTTLPQMQGYSFEPRVAEVLDDIHGQIREGADAAKVINHFLRATMVAIPIRHNLNELGFYLTDRGISSVVNPLAYARGGKSLIKAFHDVMNVSDDYKKVAATGFNFMKVDDKAFDTEVAKNIKGLLYEDQSSAERLASDLGTSVVKLRNGYDKWQHRLVWAQQDILNMARINERMSKGMSLDQAAAETERFNPQYRVPSRVAGSRTASKVLRNNNLLFFGSYHYDQWKVLANTLRDLSGKNSGKAALQAVDKMGAMALGVYVTYALADKLLQNISGNSNAYTKPFGNLDLPDELYQFATGKKDISTVLQSQIFPSITLNTAAQVFENRDFFTGKNIRDTNMPKSYQTKQIGQWLESQLPTSQQTTNAKKGGSVTGAGLALSGARFPKNSPETNNLNSLKYDTLPNIQSTAKKQAQAGDTAGAEKTISQYDKIVLNAARSALKSAGKPVPDDNTLIRQLKSKQYYYAPKPATINKWKSERPTSIVNQL